MPYLLKIGEYIDDFVNGKGIGLHADGRMQLSRLEVRDSMTVLSLIINELQAMANTFVFADCGIAEEVTKIDDNTYKIKIQKQTDADILKFKVDHVCRQIVNTIPLGGTDYYTSWFRVLTANYNDNTIQVVLYPDSDVPEGVNYPPVKDYALQRRGSANIPTDGSHNSDSDHWYLSSNEGAIRFLQNVFKPVLEDYNYAISIGKFPSIDAIKHLPISDSDTGIMAKTIVAENFYQYDYNGNIVAKEVARGAWSAAEAVSNPYRNITHAETTETGVKYHLLEQHTVEHLGFKWACLIDSTTLEPTWNSQGWRCVNATDDSYDIGFESSNGWSFFENVATEVTAYFYYGSIDITNKVMANEATVIQWTRDTGNAPEDNAWLPTYIDGAKNKVQFTTEDMGTNWNTKRRAKFTCTAYIPVDGELITSSKTIDVRK